MSSGSPDVIVVGAGVIGAASAYELARRGARVTVLERSQDANGCSFGNAGLICPSHAEALANFAAVRAGIRWMTRRDSPFRLHPRLALVPWLVRFGAASLPARSARATALLRALSVTSLELYEQLARTLPIGFARHGTLSVFESAREFERAENGSGVQRLCTAEARDLEPALARGIAGAMYHPGDAHCDPTALVGALIDAAREHGAEVRSGVELLRMRRGNGRISALDTTAGSIATDAVVLAAGSWSRGLAREVGVHVPLEAAKGYHVEIDTDLTGGIPVYMEEAHVIATPIAGRVRLAGTLELAGLDLRVDPVRVASLGRAAARTLALPRGARTVGVWRGLRPCAPDGLPVIGRPAGLKNLVLATGHAMLGVTLAPVTAEIVADLVAGAPPRHRLEPFSPARYTRRRPGRGR